MHEVNEQNTITVRPWVIRRVGNFKFSRGAADRLTRTSPYRLDTRATFQHFVISAVSDINKQILVFLFSVSFQLTHQDQTIL